jgi:uncharacterized protein (PEP-CTERM system associated)
MIDFKSGHFTKLMNIDFESTAELNNLQLRSRRISSELVQCISVLYCLLFVNPSYAVNWRVTPTAQVQEIYSDNVQLSQKADKKSALVTEVSPGIWVTGQTARTNLNLNYQMQNLYNAGGNNGLDVFHQLQYNSFHTISQNKLFLTARSTIGQQNTSNTKIAVDNISGSGNRTTVSTFGLSPYWTPTFGQYANGFLGLNYDTISTANGESNSAAASDTNTLGENIRIDSGSKFDTVSWGLSFNNSESFRTGGDNNVAFQNSNAIVRPHINKYFNFFAQGGYSKNSFDSITNANKNGLYYTLGGKWTPSRHYSLEAGYGNNSFVTVYISPFQRLSWITSYRDNDIGLNTGKTWQTALNYQTRRSSWSLTHENDTTTTQQLLSDLRVFSNNANNFQPNQFAINLPTLTDEVIVRKRWNFSVSFFSGKTSLSANAYNENRVFQVSGNNEKVRGLNGNWNWQFAPRTSVYLSPTWQETERSASLLTNSSSDNRYDIAFGIRQAITSRLYGRLEVRHLNQTSDLNTNDYQENRATANLFMRF